LQNFSLNKGDEANRRWNNNLSAPLGGCYPAPSMTLRHIVTLIGVLSFLIGGCSKQSGPPTAPSPDAPVLKVAVFADGRLTVDGTAATIQSLQSSLRTLSEKHGVVWYYREAGQQDPPPVALEVLKAVTDAGVPIQLSSRPDYSDYIDENGRSLTKKPK
jgi:hypothetical protein